MSVADQTILKAFNDGIMLLSRPALENMVLTRIAMDRRRLNRKLRVLVKHRFIFREYTNDRGAIYGLSETKKKYPNVTDKIRAVELLDDESYFIIHGPPEKYVLVRLSLKPPPNEEKKDRRRTR